MKKIKLTTKEELNIYMSHVRQQLLRHLNISNTPMTPKMLADKLNVSASSVQHHIKKLISLGVVELDHTEIVNGITARFYKPVHVTVQIGLDSFDGLDEQRDILVQNNLAEVYSGFREQRTRRMRQNEDQNFESFKKFGDILMGVVHLDKKQSDELLTLITEFIEQHSVPGEGSTPWEYAIIAYNAEEIAHD